MQVNLAGLLQAVRRVAQAGEGGATMHAADARGADAAGFIRQEPGTQCGCCVAVYRLTQRGREWLRSLGLDERGM